MIRCSIESWNGTTLKTQEIIRVLFKSEYREGFGLLVNSHARCAKGAGTRFSFLKLGLVI